MLCRPNDPLQITIDQIGLWRAADLAARDNVQAHGHMRLAGMLGCRNFRRVAECPHAFQIVKAADFGAEQVDDNVLGVDQHPISARQTFDPCVPSGMLDPLSKFLRHRRDLTRRATTRNNHMVGDVAFAF